MRDRKDPPALPEPPSLQPVPDPSPGKGDERGQNAAQNRPVTPKTSQYYSLPYTVFLKANPGADGLARVSPGRESPSQSSATCVCDRSRGP